MPTNAETFEEVYTKHLEAFIEKEPTEYGYPKDQARTVVRKMIAAIQRGSFTVYGSPAMKATARELKIKVTNAAIRAYVMGEN